jgi:hypothetical protein
LAYFTKLRTHLLVALGVMVAVAVTGCLEGGGSLTNLPENERTEVNLQIRLGRIDTDAPATGGVNQAKISVDTAERIQLREMVLRFTSNLRDTVWDTVYAGVGTGFDGYVEEDQAVSINVALRPLRWWNIEIKTYDIYDSVIHYAVAGPFASKGGQSVSLSVPLINSRYALYEARYVLPERIYSADVPEDQRVYQKIFFSRLVLSIDSTIVRDSSSLNASLTAPGARFITAGAGLLGAEEAYFFRPSRSAPDTITHLQTYRYVRTGPRNFNIKVYGYLEGDSVGLPPRLLFGGDRTVTILPGLNLIDIPIVLEWKGNERDPDLPPPGPGDRDWSGVTMQVIIGKVTQLSQTIEFNPEVP